MDEPIVSRGTRNQNKKAIQGREGGGRHVIGEGSGREHTLHSGKAMLTQKKTILEQDRRLAAVSYNFLVQYVHVTAKRNREKTVTTAKVLASTNQSRLRQKARGDVDMSNFSLALADDGQVIVRRSEPSFCLTHGPSF